MTNYDRILSPGGFAAALICLVMLTGCPGPMPGTDSGMPPDSDGGMPPDDADVPPPDSGMPPDDGGTGPDTSVPPTCTEEDKHARRPGCGELYDLFPGMTYTDSAMPSACMATLESDTWSSSNSPGGGCVFDLYREEGTNHLMVYTSCFGAEYPWDGRYRLAPDGRFMGNCGNRDDIAAPEGDCGVLTPDPDCRGLNGEFYDGGESVPTTTERAWL